MNCKPGDLAIVIKAKYTHELIGHIVQVVGPWTKNCANPDNSFPWEICYPDGRYILQSFNEGATKKLCPTRAMSDNVLRPLRDNPGQDETLQWAPVPHKEKA